MKRLFQKACSRRRRGIRFRFFAARLKDGLLAVTGDLKAMFILDSEQVALSIQPVDAAGNPATVDGVPSWSSSDTSVLTLTPSADGLSAVAAATGKLGTSTISVTLGSISGTLQVDVHSGAAVSVTISAGTPSAKTAASPGPATPPTTTAPAGS